MHHILIFVGGVIIGYIATLIILDFMEDNKKNQKGGKP